ncbi:uncharacterized protein LOC144538545 [Centroberyx gerrardi]
MAVPLPDPCLSSPCHNGGVCSVLTSDPAGFRCSCPPNTKGPVCHRQLRQACWEPRPENSCLGVQPFQRHWAFNPTSGVCEDFLYCTGNSSNNFPSLNACRDQCMLGACCLRKPKQGLPTGHQDYNQHGYNISYADTALGGYDQHNLEDEAWYSNIDFNLTELDDVRERERKKGWKKERDKGSAREDCSEDLDFTYTCEYVSLMQCQASVKALAGEAQAAEAVSFSPGGKCSEVSCGGGCGCLSQRQLWRYGERFRQGCEECICTRGGKVDCVCTHLTQRKEIRDLTVKERKLYHRAAGGHAFFLPWHRYFLRLVERELQSLSSCQLAVPYFEWTVDSGSMRSSAAWQAGLFGGDGESGSGCVPHHPFQGWTSRSYWSPCLRRSFNSSVWLPDAVTLQRIVNQGDFQMLSQSLQAFSGLFRLWVGGHMASPLAAYDPLYLSHMAFMDKLWTQWQEKHQHVDEVAHIYKDSQTPGDEHAQGDIHYPARQRHVKMKPFDVTPDDVMSSQQQMCVVYVPITIGAPCNVTSLHAHPQRSDYTDDYNTERYRNHGSDPHGYDHDGYDSSGWDRWGYGRDGFNRDFIDRDGYDVSGFNRYGFNRSNVSWFGMRRDGVTDGEKEKEHGVKDGEEESDEKTEVQRDKIMSELFSDRGYSIYGFDPFGMDQGGLDAFGFGTDGYDKDSCNWFFNGPHYLRFYFHTQQQLMSSSTQALNRITRTCPPITSLPQHWAMKDWMTLDPEESGALIGRLEQEWVGQKKSESGDSIMAATQNRKDIWLPVTPDHRLCFKLHWFSGCPLGSAPITCPDLCRQARCHGYPEAVCHMHNCGSCFTEWLDPATGGHVICHDW